MRLGLPSSGFSTAQSADRPVPPTRVDLKFRRRVPCLPDGGIAPTRRRWRSALLPQLLIAPLAAGSFFLLPATIVEAQQGNQTSNEISLPVWVQLLIEPNGVLAAFGLGSPIRLAVVWATREMTKSRNLTIKGALDQQSGAITKSHDSLNIIKGALDQQSSAIIKNHDSLNIIKGVLDQQSSAITKSHDSLNTIKGALDQQSSAITKSHDSLNTINGALDQQSGEINTIKETVLKNRVSTQVEIDPFSSVQRILKMMMRNSDTSLGSAGKIPLLQPRPFEKSCYAQSKLFLSRPLSHEETLLSRAPVAGSSCCSRFPLASARKHCRNSAKRTSKFTA